MRKKVFISGLIGLLLFCPVIVMAQSISGRVTFMDNKFSTATITLYRADTTTVVVTTTAASSLGGGYSLGTVNSPLAPGVYDLKITAPNYRTITLGNVNVSSGVSIPNFDFDMPYTSAETIFSWGDASNTGFTPNSNKYLEAPAGLGSKKVVWTPNIAETSDYDLYALWTGGDNRATNVVYEVTDGNGVLNTIVVNQKGPLGVIEIVDSFILSVWGHILIDHITFSNTDGTGEVIFDDFEDGNYDGWTLSGTAMGTQPSQGAESGQSTVSGFEKLRLVNSFIGGDTAAGSMVSAPFVIDKDRMNYYIGGGSHPAQTCMNIKVNDEIVFSATGNDSETMVSTSCSLTGIRQSVVIKLGTFAFNQGTSGGRIEVTDNANGYVIAEKIKIIDTAFTVKPSQPEGFYTKVTNDGIELNWNPPSTGLAPAYYNVYRSTFAGESLRKANINSMPVARNVSGTTWLDTSAKNSKWYYYAVTSVNRKYAESAPSLEVGEILTPLAQITCDIWKNKFNPAKSEKMTVKYVINGVDSGTGNISIYNSSGGLVKKLVKNQYMEKGVKYNQEWDGRNENGEIVANGIYIVNMSVNGVNATRKIVILK